MVNLLSELGASVEKEDKDEYDRTSLYIVFALVQREMVELLVPMQAIVVLTLLEIKSAPRTNSLVAKWTLADFQSARLYLLFDVLVESFVFFSTILVLRIWHPEQPTMTILYRIMRQNFVPLMGCIFVAWSYFLYSLSTYSGNDMGFEFDWLFCDDRPEFRWDGGLDWVWGENATAC